MDVGKIGRTMLKPRAFVHELFYLFVIELNNIGVKASIDTTIGTKVRFQN